VAAVGEDAHAERVPLGDDALAVECGQQRDLEPLDQPPDLRSRSTPDGTEADERHDALPHRDGVRQHRCDLLHARRIGQNRRDIKPDGPEIPDLEATLGQIFGNVNVHRPRPSLERDVDCFLEHAAGVRDVRQQEGLLGRGREHGP
jgi:hypothetical protein